MKQTMGADNTVTKVWKDEDYKHTAKSTEHKTEIIGLFYQNLVFSMRGS
tara:strand:- start:236 stop:382 length:147 start_codon:yes stop_codon:yes gene_type:complete